MDDGTATMGDEYLSEFNGRLDGASRQLTPGVSRCHGAALFPVVPNGLRTNGLRAYAWHVWISLCEPFLVQRVRNHQSGFLPGLAHWCLGRSLLYLRLWELGMGSIGGDPVQPAFKTGTSVKGSSPPFYACPGCAIMDER